MTIVQYSQFWSVPDKMKGKKKNQKRPNEKHRREWLQMELDWNEENAFVIIKSQKCLLTSVNWSVLAQAILSIIMIPMKFGRTTTSNCIFFYLGELILWQGTSRLCPNSSWFRSTIPHGAIPMLTTRPVRCCPSSSNASPTCFVTPEKYNSQKQP